MRQLKLFSMCFLCLMFSLGAGLLFLQEIRVLMQPQRSEQTFFDHLASRVPQYGPSSYSKKIVLGDCTFGLLSSGGMNEEKSASVARSCERLASGIAETMPTNSQAWYVKAFAHARLGETEAFLDSYRRSRDTGPKEQWLAENRVRLAEDMFAHLDERSRNYHEEDLILLANSWLGTKSLAQRYASNEDFRARIVDIVSRLPPERQRAFLNNVRRVLR